jgi:hypothetical protein
VVPTPLYDCCHLDHLIALLVPDCCAYPGFVPLVSRVKFVIIVTGSVSISGSTNLFISGTFLIWFSIQMLVFEIVRLVLFDS